MIKISLQKIKNQKWLSVCLILGIVLLVASFVCQPMFEKGSMDKLLQQTFVDYIDDYNRYPVSLQRKGQFELEEIQTLDDMIAKNEEYAGIWSKYIDNIDPIITQSHYVLPKISGLGAYKERNAFYEITCMPDILDHINIINGTDFNVDMVDGAYPCIISEAVMDQVGFTLGEKITFDKYSDKDGNMLVLYVAGVFDVSDNEDPFWEYSPYENNKEIYVSNDVFNNLLASGDYSLITFEYTTILDHADIDSSKVDNLLYYMNEFSANDGFFKADSKAMFEKFVKKGKSVSVMFWVLEIPIFGMVLAFIYMVSKQIVESESSEIAMLKSRGFSRFQIIKMYAAQTGILAIFGYVIGIFVGCGFCLLAASTNNFLSFSAKDISFYKFIPIMLLYGLVATIVGILFVLFPVLKHSKISIVEQKADYKIGKRMLWEKCFLDVALLAVSCYLVFNYRKNINDIRLDAIVGNKMDPVIFLNTCLFILSAGLVVFRLIHYLVKLVYLLGKKKWKPVSYVSFLQIYRTFRNQCFIAVFLIMTVALGIFNANIARTINGNKEERLHHEIGADVISKEYWKYRDYQKPDRTIHRRYFEPAYSRYEDLIDEGLVDNVTRVYDINKTNVSNGKKSIDNCMVLGIETKKIGETAYLNEQLNAKIHWYNPLNTLAVAPDGILVSKNLADLWDLKEGSLISFNGLNALDIDKDKIMSARVVGTFEEFPGYDRYKYVNGEEVENYLILANYGTLVSNFDVHPYQVWYDLADGVTSDDLYNYMIENGFDIRNFTSLTDDIETMNNTPDIQVTNGLFTLSFVIALVLCGVGFLIYWVASIRKRELLFGVYRAMGLSVKNINGMLILEHIFSTFLSVLSGAGVGIIATILFVKIFGTVYLPERSNLELTVCYEIGDIIKLFVVLAIMITICLLVLRRLIKKLNITQALKLGED